MCLSCVLLQLGAQIQTIKHRHRSSPTCCPMPGGSSAHGFAFSSPAVLAFRYLWLSLDSDVSTILCPLKFLTAALFAKLASLCLPYSPLSLLLSPCSYLQLLLGLVSSSAPLLKALEFYCSEKNAKACGYQRLWYMAMAIPTILVGKSWQFRIYIYNGRFS